MATNQVIHGSNRVIEHPNRYKQTLVTGTTDTYDLTPVTGEVISTGTPYSKNILDKVDNVLSYLTPSVEREEIIETAQTRFYLQFPSTIGGTTINSKMKNDLTNDEIDYSFVATGSAAKYGFRLSTSQSTYWISFYGALSRSTTSYEEINNFFKNRSLYDENYGILFEPYSVTSTYAFEMKYNLTNKTNIKLDYAFASISSAGKLIIETSSDDINYSELASITSSGSNIINIPNNSYLKIKSTHGRFLMQKLEILADVLIPTYINHFTLDNNGNTFTNNQRILIETLGGKLIDEIKSKTVFNNTDSYDIVSTELQNGNIFIAFRDVNNSNYGSYVILDSDGNIIKNKTVFNNTNTQAIKLTTLQNNNIFIAFYDADNSNYGSYIILDSNGNVIKSKTIFNNTTTALISLIKLQNNNIFIAFRDGSNPYYGSYIILDSYGNIVKNKTVFNSANTSNIFLTELQNGNIFIAFRDEENSSYGSYVILDRDYNIVKNKTVFNNTATSYISLIELQNGNKFIVFQDSGNAGYGSYVILDGNENVVKSKTVFNNAYTGYISSIKLQDNNILIAFFNDINGSESGRSGSYVILDSDGNKVQSKTAFNNTGVGVISLIKLQNDNIFITFREIYNPNGSFLFYKYNINIMSIDNVISNTLNGIEIPTLLQPSTKYELVYDEYTNKFELGGTKVLYDITLTEAVNQVDLTGIASKLEEEKLYTLIFIGNASSETTIYFGDTVVTMLGEYGEYGFSLFRFYNFVGTIAKKISVLGSGTSSNSLQSNLITTEGVSYENIRTNNNNHLFNVGTRIIIKEIC